MAPFRVILFRHALLVLLLADATPIRAAAPQETRQTLEQLEASANRGDADSARELGDRHFHGRDGLAKDEARAVHWYRKAADQGHAMALADLGYCTLNGLGGLAKDAGKALALFQAADARGNAYAARMIGWMCEWGKGIPRDDGKAAGWYRRAADLDDEDALVSLAWLTECGRGVPKDDEAAAKMYAVGISKGNARAMNNLGWFYVTGRGGLPKDYDLARRMFEIAAVKGDARADGNLGYLYENGMGVPRDIGAALSHYRDAVAGGDLLAQQHLGHVYEFGQLVPRDPIQSFHFFRLAAAQGDRPSLHGLTRILLTKPSLAPDDAASLLPLCRDSLAQGHHEARLPLALALLFGIGTPVQTEEAKKLFLEATREQPPSPYLPAIAKQFQLGLGTPRDPGFARSLLESMAEHGASSARVDLAKSLLDEPDEFRAKGLSMLQELSRSGDAKAAFELGLLHQNGRGVPHSPTKAMALFTQAAEGGLAEAMFHLGLIHQAGIGVKQNPPKAKIWYLKAEAAGWPLARGRVLPDGKLAPLNTLPGFQPTK